MPSLNELLTSSAIGSLADWGIVLAVAGALAFLIVRIRRRASDTKPEAQTLAPAHAVGPVRSREELAVTSPPDRQSLATMQSQATFQVDAAEHALNRLLGECAAVMKPPVAPTVEAVRELPAEQPAKGDRSSLAA